MIHIDGFEEFAAGSSSPTPWITRAEYAVVGNWSTVGGRSSARDSTALAGAGCALIRNFQWTTSKFVAGLAFQCNARGSIMSLKIGNARVTLWLDPVTGLPMLNAQPGGSLPTVNRWYYYELELTRDTVNLYVNHKLDASLPLATAGATVVEVTLGYTAPSVYGQAFEDKSQKYIDDFLVRDGDRLGPVVVATRFPDIDVNTQWFSASTAGSHAQNLSMHPPSPLDHYVASDTVGRQEIFRSTAALPNADAILATGVVVMARKSPTLNAKLGVTLGGQPGAALRGDARVVESEWRTQYVCFEPNASDTPAGITASEFGVVVLNP